MGYQQHSWLTWPVVQDRGTCRVYRQVRFICYLVHLCCRLGAAMPDGMPQRHLSIMSPTPIRTVLATLWITACAGGLLTVAMRRLAAVAASALGYAG